MIVFNSFVKYKAHIGHSIKNTILLTTWFLYKLRRPLWIINIFKTILFIKIIFRFIRFLVNNRFPLWFVNLEVTRELLFKNYANYCGEFYCTKLWIRGFLSNFKSIQDSMNRFILKKYIAKVTAKAFYANNWAVTRYTWPRGIFISNIKSNYIIAKEAGCLNLPMIAVVDTNIKNFLFNLPIPGNSESKESLSFIVSVISCQVLLMKYKKLLNWYTLFKLQKVKNIKNYTKLYEELKQNSFPNILKRKKSTFFSLNSFKKLKESMHLLKTPIKIDNSLIIVKSIDKLISKYKFIKKAFVFTYFFKTAIFKLNLKASKAYKKNIKNFIKFSKMSAWYFYKKKKNMYNVYLETLCH
jgi:ribosomal protein S2